MSARIELNMDRGFTVLNVLFPFAAIPENTPKCDTGPEGIDMNVNPPAWTKDTEHLPHYLLRLIGVM